MSKFACRALVALVALALVVLLSSPPPVMAESNGVGLTPAMGWSSWSFLRAAPTETAIEAQAKAMVTSGLARVGYEYVNVDSGWYSCPGPQGPAVDRYGRWDIDAKGFPSHGPVSGIKVVADYAHHLGLKFGLYVTPGISEQAVARNTVIKGTRDHADDIATGSAEYNYDCGGMVGIDYAKGGAQAFINSWADEFASWGVDYVKLDGVGSFDIPDVEAWSHALTQTGRIMRLELSNSLNIADDAVWARYSNGWRTGGDIECYCSSTSYPLTDWANVASRFDQVAASAPYGRGTAHNDYDSIEVGNGTNDGLTPAERQTQMSLWALGASPMILGVDLTHLNHADVSYLKNRAVIAIDQGGIDAQRIIDTDTEQAFTETEPEGDHVVGLFNMSSQPAVMATTAKAVGMPAQRRYRLVNLWTHQRSETTGIISAEASAHGVALFRVTRDHS
jgi:hypothetical protein